MNASMRKRIEKAEGYLVRPAETFVRTILLARPREDAGTQAWADYERVLAQARQDGCKVIVLVPILPNSPASP